MMNGRPVGAPSTTSVTAPVMMGRPPAARMTGPATSVYGAKATGSVTTAFTIQ